MKIATRIALIGIVTSAVGIGSVRVTAASDFCIFDGETVVGRNFSPPGAGKCKQWLGYEVNGEGGPNSSTGSGCTSADGSHVTITVTTLYPTGDIEDTMAVVPLPLGPAPSVTVSAVAPGGTYGLRKIVPPTAGPCKPAPPAP